jgi:quercetin dioxygenase-like cupin family protein
MLKPIRRVITGHDSQGRSIVLSDSQTTTHDIGSGRMTLYDIWSVSRTPVNIEATEPDPTAIPLDFEIPKTGLRVRYLDVPPASGASEPFMHRTESLDIVVIIDGEMTMPMDGQDIVLRTGDVLIQRGTNHAWVNRSDRVCRVLYIIIAGKLSPELMESLGITEVVWDGATGGTSRT